MRLLDYQTWDFDELHGELINQHEKWRFHREQLQFKARNGSFTVGSDLQWVQQNDAI